MKLPEKSQLKIVPIEEYLKNKQLDEDKKFLKYIDNLIEFLGLDIKHNAKKGLNYATLWIDDEICKHHNKDIIHSYELCQKQIDSYEYKSAILTNHLGNKFLKVYLDDTTDEEIQNEIKEYKRDYIEFCVEVFGLLGLGLISIVLILFKLI